MTLRRGSRRRLVPVAKALIADLKPHIANDHRRIAD